MNVALPIALVAASLAAFCSTGSGAGLPGEGAKIPDVTAFDEAGKPFPLRKKLAGKHAVIVFGCLT